MQGIQNCLANKVFTGVCTSLCQTNFDDLLTEQWIDSRVNCTMGHGSMSPQGLM